MFARAAEQPMERFRLPAVIQPENPLNCVNEILRHVHVAFPPR